MLRPVLAISLGVLVSACQMRTSPQDYSLSLDAKEKKFNSSACVEKREQAKAYEINYAPSVAASLIVAPIGGLMMSIEDNRRYQFLRELHAACSTKPAPEAWDWPLRQTN